MTTHQIDDTMEPPGTDTVRLSARDIRQATWRAMVAAGASAGESRIAADAVVFAELFFGAGTGIGLVLEELHLNAGAGTPVRMSGETPTTLENEADRGLLLLAPLAIGIVAARPALAPVFLADLGWSNVLAGLLLRHSGQGAPSFFGFEHRHGTLTQGCRVDPDTSITVYTEEGLGKVAALNPELTAMLGRMPAGLVLTSDFGGLHPVDAAVTITPQMRRERELHVYGSGLRVDRHLWDELEAASRAYLVEEL